MALNNPWARFFDGVDDWGQIYDTPAQRTYPLTIELAVSLNRAPTGRGEMIIGKHSSASSTYGYGLYVYPDNLLAWALKAGDPHSFPGITAPLPSVGVPFLVSVALSTTKANLYIDGVLVGTLSASIPVPRNYEIRLAKSMDSYWSLFSGTIDELRFWSTFRTAEEIASTKNKYLRGDEPGLAELYRFDEEAGTSLVDSKAGIVRGAVFGATRVPGIIDLDLRPPGEVILRADLRARASISAKAIRGRGISATLQGAATSTGGTPIRIRGLSANLQGAGTTKARMNLIAALKAHLQGQATLKSNMLVLFVPEGVYVIDADEIFAKDQPSRGQTVVNHVEVWVNPLKPKEEPEEVYRSKDPVTIPAGQAQTVTIQFDDEPVTEPAVTLEEAGANLSITATKYYAWGADVTIQNSGSTDQTCIIVATGRPLEVTGREKVVREDPVSIQEVGLKKYEFDNPFVQDRKTAEMIAERLLSYANARRDISIEWRGDPALQLADIVMIPEYQRKGLDQRGIFYVTKQELEFGGGRGLRAKLEGRKM